MDSSAATPSIASLLEERAWLRRLAGALVRDDDLAEDLTQDTYAAALQQPLDGIRSPRRWLGAILRHRARNVIRGERRRRQRDRQHGHRDAARSADEVVARAELADRVGREVLALREPYRSAILLRYYEGEPPRRIAARLEVPVETARTRVRRGLALLRERFAEQEGRSRSDWRSALLPLLGAPDAVPTEAAGATTMAKTAALVTLLVVGVGAGVIWWAPWSESGRGDESPSPSPVLRAGQPTDASESEVPAPRMGGTDIDAGSPSGPDDGPGAGDSRDASRDDSTAAPGTGSEGAATNDPESSDPEDPATSPEAACVLRVVDDRGEPVPGVRLTFYQDPARPVNAPTAVTGEDGTASFPISDAPEQMHVVKVPPPGRQGGFGRRSVWQTHELVITSDVVRSEGVRDVVLRRLHPILGQVLAPDGTPLAGAWVAEDVRDSRLPQVHADAEGRFRFPAPVGEALDLLALDAGPRATPPGGRLRGTATDVRPGITGLVIRTQDTSAGRPTLKVRVLDPGGEPIANARVAVLVQDATKRRLQGRTDGQGVAVFEALPAGRVAIGVLSDSPPWMPGGPRSRDLIYEYVPDVRPGDEEVVVRVRKGERLTIRVVTREGVGVRGVRVRLLRDGKPLVLYGGPMPFQKTWDDGNCVLLLPPDLDGPLTVEAAYSADVKATVPNVDPRQGLVTVQLDR